MKSCFVVTEPSHEGNSTVGLSLAAGWGLGRSGSLETGECLEEGSILCLHHALLFGKKCEESGRFRVGGWGGGWSGGLALLLTGRSGGGLLLSQPFKFLLQT